MNELAERWARHVAQRPMGAGWGLVAAVNGALFIALFFVLDLSSMSVFLAGALMIMTGFHLFERAGFLRLLEDGKARDASDRPEREGAA